MGVTLNQVEGIVKLPRTAALTENKVIIIDLELDAPLNCLNNTKTIKSDTITQI